MPVPCALTQPTSSAASRAARSPLRIAAAMPEPSGRGVVGWCASAARPRPPTRATAFAPRRSACSADSTTRNAAPSPSVIPRRPAANGVHPSGAIARIRAKPTSAIRENGSAPPASATSTRPEATARAAAPIA